MKVLHIERYLKALGLVALPAIILLLTSCISTPTSTPTTGTQGLTVDLLVLPTVDPTHTHIPVIVPGSRSGCAEVQCMGHMYAGFVSGTITTGVETKGVSAFIVLHDHPIPNSTPELDVPDLTNSTIALVDHSSVVGSSPTPQDQGPIVDIYFDPTWDLKMDPGVISNTQVCDYSKEDRDLAQRKLDRVLKVLAPQLLNAHSDPTIRDQIPVNTPFDPLILPRRSIPGLPKPQELYKPAGPGEQPISLATLVVSSSPTPVVNFGSANITCIVVGTDRNVPGGLVIGITGLPVVKGVTTNPGVTINLTPTVTPSP
jgi:hypothetical protein